jgi:protein phosphatase PTC1
MVVRFDNKALKQRKTDAQFGVDRDPPGTKPGISEADAIVAQAKKESGEPEVSVESAAKQVIQEEDGEQEENGPELNAGAVKAARKNPA